MGECKWGSVTLLPEEALEDKEERVQLRMRAQSLLDGERVLQPVDLGGGGGGAGGGRRAAAHLGIWSGGTCSAMADQLTTSWKMP